jgi:hypothetical protein
MMVKMPQVMTSTTVRLPLFIVAALLGGVHSGWAQRSPASVERIRIAMESPQPPLSIGGVPLLGPTKPDETHWGILTLVPPDRPGQMMNVRVPVGDLVSRAAHSVAAAQHHRAEKAAHAEVVKALEEFEKAQAR